MNLTNIDDFIRELKNKVPRPVTTVVNPNDKTITLYSCYGEHLPEYLIILIADKIPIDWKLIAANIVVQPIKDDDKIDNVNHPKHYTSHPSGVECIEVTRHMTFNIGNVIKYLWRCGLKDGSPTIQELEKAQWYLNDEILRLKNESNKNKSSV